MTGTLRAPFSLSLLFACVLAAASASAALFGCPVSLHASARDEAADLHRAVHIHIRPDDRRAELVGLFHDRVVGNDNPLPMQLDTIAAVLRVPIDVLHRKAIGERAAKASAAGEVIKPGVQRTAGVAVTLRSARGRER